MDGRKIPTRRITAARDQRRPCPVVCVRGDLSTRERCPHRGPLHRGRLWRISSLAFKYILETGAGWKDTIGSADLVVRLPYEANEYHVIFGSNTGFSETSPGAAIVGNELRWHYEDLEPAWEDNFEVSWFFPSCGGGY